MQATVRRSHRSLTGPRRLVALIALSLAGTAGFVAAAPGANASTSYCNSSTCSLASSPYTSTIYYEMPRGTPVRMLCWTSTQYWNGTAKWFKVSTRYGNGYMNANQVSAQTVVGRC